MSALSISIFILLLIIIFLLWKIRNLNSALAAVVKKIRDVETLGKGLSDYKDAQDDRRQQHKNAIIEMLKSSDRITILQIQEALHISHSAAGRYVDELQAEGKVKQRGDTGQAVYYTL